MSNSKFRPHGAVPSPIGDYPIGVLPPLKPQIQVRQIIIHLVQVLDSIAKREHAKFFFLFLRRWADSLTVRSYDRAEDIKGSHRFCWDLRKGMIRSPFTASK